MPKLISTKTYDRKLARFNKRHPDLLQKYFKTILLLGDNPQHPSLRLHKLKGQLQQFQSVSINMQYRIMIDFIIKDDVVYLLDIGEHNEIYGSL